MKLCVFSYRKHFKVMQLAIHQALHHLPITSVEIFWDDYSSPVPQHLPWAITGYSKVCDTATQSSGWIRQQYVKLNLHRVLSDHDWLVLDADTVLRHSWDFSGNQWYYDPYESCNDYWSFAKFAVNVDATEQRYMSPLWKCERDVLVAMEEKIFSKHNASLETVFARSNMQKFSEVEMYALFATQILNRTYQFVPHKLRMAPTIEFVDAWNTTSDDICLGGSDDVDPLFWKQWPEIIVDSNCS